MTKKAVEAVSIMVNNMSYNPEEFVKMMGIEHRTLQQSFTRLCVAWMEHMALKYDQNKYDGRNEASAKLGKLFVENIEEEDRYLPLI
jgi:hypothetical protein